MSEVGLPSPPTAARPLIVLDTNVLLDGWVFGNPAWAPIGQALAQQQVQWIATPWMLDELRWVLARPLPARFEAARQHALANSALWQQALIQSPPETEQFPRLRCADRSDQAFIDLALAAGARWLISRDKALLKLARRAALYGVRIATPEHWADASA